MLDLSSAILLSIIEGITEFLPISSTGHLTLASALLGLQDTQFLRSFEIIIQSGAILAVLSLYWRRLLTDLATFKKVAVAFLPTGILGLLLYKFIKQALLGNTLITLAALFLGGIIIIWLETRIKNQIPTKEIRHLSYIQSLLIGLAQSVSMIPGVSRSGASIIGAMLLGLKRKEAVEFSFLLAIPTMFVATGYDFVKNHNSFQPDQFYLLIAGLIGSYISALIVVKWFLKFVQTNSLVPFGIYRIVISIGLFWILL